MTSVKKAREERLPPGSFGLPLLGETLSYARDPHAFFESRVKKHGPVFKTKLLGKPTVVLTGPDAFTLFVTQTYFARQDANPPFVQRLLGDCLPFLDGAEHARRKTIVLAALGPDTVDRCVGALLAALSRRVPSWTAQPEVVLLHELKAVSVDVARALFFGNDEQETPASPDVGATLDTFVAGLTALPLRLPWTRYGRALRARDWLRAWLERAALRTPMPAMLDAMAAARAADGSRLTADQLRDEGLHLLFALYTGVYDALLLLMWDLARNPDVREKARQEALSIALGDRPLGHRGLGAFPYIGAVCREVRRADRINPATFFATVTSPFDVEGYRVPSGWRVVAGIYTTMHLPGVFAGPERFDPERFLPGGEAERVKENSFVPHGGGPDAGHRCAGEGLIGALMVAAGVHLLRGYRWEPVASQDDRLDRSLFPLPRSGLRVRVRGIS